MKLLEIFKQIKDETLPKDLLESYHKELSELRGQMRLELADITKKKAIFMLENKETPAVHRKINWQGTEEGLREIDLKAYIGATSDNLNSLKSRLYSLY